VSWAPDCSLRPFDKREPLLQEHADYTATHPELALRKARAKLFAQMDRDKIAMAKIHPSLEWRNLPPAPEVDLPPRTLVVQWIRAGLLRSQSTHELRPEEINGADLSLVNHLASGEHYTGVLMKNAWKAHWKWVHEELDRAGCF
jgi:hypothetical protein